MILIVCIGCGRSAMVPKPIRKPCCSNCGSKACRVYKHVKIWMNTERSQLDRDRARWITMARLLWLANEWHYKEQWASTQFHKIFDTWPARPYPTPAEPPEMPLPGAELVHWALREKAKFARKAARVKTLTPGD